MAPGEPEMGPRMNSPRGELGTQGKALPECPASSTEQPQTLPASTRKQEMKLGPTSET